MNRPKAVIIDLDGTLCDTRHRSHFVEHRFNKNFDAFHDACVHDKPQSWCKYLVSKIASDLKVILVSGRPDSHKGVTIDWLNRHKIPFDELFMRRTGDYRRDCDVKLEIYRRQIAPRFEVQFCVDDRKQVVEMWREQGLTCLQCAEGDF